MAASSVCFAAVLLAALLPAANAQYPGHIDTNKTAGPSPRAIAVLEWTGQPGKPSASRIIPLSVFDGETYQPGGFYLARPEPLALEPGTEYILEKAGLPVGLFDVNAAQDMQGYWFGYGVWRPLVAATTHKLQPAKSMAPGTTESDNGRPHFKNRSSTAQEQSSGGGKTSAGLPPAAGSTQNSSSPAPAGPDRPVLRRSSASDSSASLAPPSPETPIGGPDPDRPHLSYGRHNPTDTQFEGTNLTGTPADLRQMIGVSDAVDRAPHSFVYSWPTPGDAARMRTQMAALAQKALAPARRPEPAAAPLLPLTDEQFTAYQLTYGGGATVVFSAQTRDAAGKTHSITLIAQPDFYGVPHVIFQSVTDDEDLDVQPRMRLVDAVDAQANDHGDLVFELRSRHDRQFAIYEVAADQVRQIFTTGPLPDANAR